MGEWARLTPGKQNKVSVRVYRCTTTDYPRRLRHLIGTGYQRGVALSVRRSVRLSDPELLALANVTKVWREVDEVKALVADVRFARKHFLTLKAIYETVGDDHAEKWVELADRFGVHLAPFEEEAKCTAI